MPEVFFPNSAASSLGEAENMAALITEAEQFIVHSQAMQKKLQEQIDTLKARKTRLRLANRSS